MPGLSISSGMYSHVFAVRFDKSVPTAAQVRFLAELFELPTAVEGRATDVYWCMLTHEGFCEFYSNTLEATDLIRERLRNAEQQGFLKQVKPGFGSAIRFCRRVVAGIFASAMRAISRRQDQSI
jgi:hypothetical protein